MTLLNKVTTNSFSVQCSMFIVRVDASGTEIILLLYFNSSSIGFTYCYSPEHKGTQVAAQLNNVYGDSLVLLVQRSSFQTLKRR